jgi:hypothetical protein
VSNRKASNVIRAPRLSLSAHDNYFGSEGSSSFSARSASGKSPLSRNASRNSARLPLVYTKPRQRLAQFQMNPGINRVQDCEYTAE